MKIIYAARDDDNDACTTLISLHSTTQHNNCLPAKKALSIVCQKKKTKISCNKILKLLTNSTDLFDAISKFTLLNRNHKRDNLVGERLHVVEMTATLLDAIIISTTSTSHIQSLRTAMLFRGLLLFLHAGLSSNFVSLEVLQAQNCAVTLLPYPIVVQLQLKIVFPEGVKENVVYFGRHLSLSVVSNTC
ncbi:hypothetical protein FF38_10111 [Lucilia cuprina]|uniref:Uncharacterized protein n=1 Tax=Lucilia cuprina TaxID=7375 RepID=A0A0L0CP85_LUCCU|nr:hypothetical protein FF38_10111 [Lucilia cuprina]